MIISLIGMSNCGKSHWSKKLEAESGYVRLCCDDMIADQLSELLPDVNINDMDEFAAWMGMPYEFGYAEREAAYLAAEETALYKVMDHARGEKVVIDTTGSVIYLSEKALRLLSQMSTVAYLGATDKQLQEMTELFFQNPKPLVWSENFSIKPTETPEQSLKRSYPSLLTWRQGRYKMLADITIPYEHSHDPSYSVDKFLYDVLQHEK
jgi:shikimate kinase